MHTLLDLRGNIPSFIHVSDGKLHDVHALDLLLPEAKAAALPPIITAISTRDPNTERGWGIRTSLLRSPSLRANLAFPCVKTSLPKICSIHQADPPIIGIFPLENGIGELMPIRPKEGRYQAGTKNDRIRRAP